MTVTWTLTSYSTPMNTVKPNCQRFDGLVSCFGLGARTFLNYYGKHSRSSVRNTSQSPRLMNIYYLISQLPIFTLNSIPNLFIAYSIVTKYMSDVSQTLVIEYQ